MATSCRLRLNIAEEFAMGDDGQLEIAFYEYPRGSGRSEQARQHSQAFLNEVRFRYHIECNIRLMDGRGTYADFADLLNEVLTECDRQNIPIDIYWLHHLPIVAREPEAWRVAVSEDHLSFVGAGLKHAHAWFERLVAEPARWRRPALH